MNNTMRGMLSTMLALALAAAAGPVLAQAKGKIICWKDSSGKVVGCGDSVPPEFQNSATKELDKRGVTRKTTESAAEQASQVRAPNTDLSRQKEQKEEEQRKIAEQRRQDNALINTFANANEIDAKRDRDLQVLDLQAAQLKVSLKNANDHLVAINTRSQALEKSKRPVPDSVTAEKIQITEEIARLQQRIAAKDKEMDGIRMRYAEYRKRFAELKGNPQPAAAATGSSAPGK